MQARRGILVVTLPTTLAGMIEHCTDVIGRRFASKTGKPAFIVVDMYRTTRGPFRARILDQTGRVRELAMGHGAGPKTAMRSALERFYRNYPSYDKDGNIRWG